MTTSQAPIGSGFGASTTAAEVIKGINLNGKNVIVTGGYSGIGLETVRAFRSVGAKVIVPARDMVKAKKNLAETPDVVLAPIDLLDPTSIDEFAKWFLSKNDKLHIQVNNAGIWLLRFRAIHAVMNPNSPPIISVIFNSLAVYGPHWFELKVLALSHCLHTDTGELA